MKNAMINHLESINKGADMSAVATRLYYGENSEYVQDFTPFANEGYMSQGLLDSLKNNKTLTDDQVAELKHYIIEKAI